MVHGSNSSHGVLASFRSGTQIGLRLDSHLGMSDENHFTTIPWHRSIFTRAGKSYRPKVNFGTLPTGR